MAKYKYDSDLVSTKSMFTSNILDSRISGGYAALPLNAIRFVQKKTLIEHFILRREMAIGRDRGVPLFIADDSISRLHAKLVLRENGIHVLDCGSSSGTYLNETRLTPRDPVPLKAGDRLRFGSTSAEFDVFRQG